MSISLPKKFLLNTNWVFIEKISKAVISGLTSILIARYLGAEGLGVIAIVLAVFSIFSVVGTLGLDRVLLKELEVSKSVETLVGSVVALRFTAAILGFVLINVYSFFAYTSEQVQWMIFAISFAFFFAVGNTFEAFYRKALRSEVATMVRVLGLLASAAAKIIFLFFDANIIWFAIPAVLETFLVCACYVFLWRVKKDIELPPLCFSLTECKRLIRLSWPLTLSGIVGTLFFQMDKMFLYDLADEATLGQYALLVQIVSIVLFAFAAFNMSSVPILNKLFFRSKEQFWQRYQEATALKFLLALFAGGGLILFGNPVITFFVGPEFHYSTATLVIFALYVVVVAMSSLKTEYCLLNGIVKPLFYLRVLTLILNFILNYLLIPRWGIEGASVATLISYFANEVVFPLFIKEMRVALFNEYKSLLRLLQPSFYLNLRIYLSKAR
ncbi:flippase [Alteromonas sp. a30]|uniref:flippase n=1 Tax=Alteromonas sp. a30 TaxID=2730917 RepID=UPI0022810300|nr:flippase [Alteromonas sp. a30]MCY7294353.1 flippase [Alteromonas sp. a30]